MEPARSQSMNASKGSNEPRPPRRLLWFGVTAVSALSVGVALGTAAGAGATCGSQCGFDVAVFEAYGTWAGALFALIIAVVAGVYTWDRHRAETADAAAKVKAESDAAIAMVQAEELKAQRKARSRALMCAMRAQPTGDGANGFKTMRFSFENKVKDAVLWPTLVLPGNVVVVEEELIWPGRIWVKDISLTALGLTGKYLTAKEAKTAFNALAREKVGFEFTVRGYRFARRGNTLTLVKPDDGLGATIERDEES